MITTMCNKSIQSQPIHQLLAGVLPGDCSTEIFGCRETKAVFTISNGSTQPFFQLHPKMKEQLLLELDADAVASADLRELPVMEALEQYAFCIYGGADHEADFNAEGVLQKPDPFLCSNNCRCLKWKSKQFIVNGTSLTPRQVQIVQAFSQDQTDAQIADALFISLSTLDTHKTKIFQIFDVHSKTGLVTKAIQLKIIQ